ncbi:hypothetical protein Syun_002955 [Stephania yunnanensis]|uniref:Uncharacterized protein n=1 Tax=Stephania yunnanensis TaxID=152371 RepID=A0AAP0PZQ8_9MAGN
MDKGSASQKKSIKVSNLLKLVQEREMSRKNYLKQHDLHLNKDHENNKQQITELVVVPNLTNDCIIEILLRLPLDQSLWDSSPRREGIRRGILRRRTPPRVQVDIYLLLNG